MSDDNWAEERAAECVRVIAGFLKYVEGEIPSSRAKKEISQALREAREEGREIERQNNICDACGGTGKPISGLNCMCGGSGRMNDAAIFLRREVREAEQRGWQRGMDDARALTSSLTAEAKGNEATLLVLFRICEEIRAAAKAEKGGGK